MTKKQVLISSPSIPCRHDRLVHQRTPHWFCSVPIRIWPEWTARPLALLIHGLAESCRFTVLLKFLMHAAGPGWMVQAISLRLVVFLQALVGTGSGLPPDCRSRFLLRVDVSDKNRKSDEKCHAYNILNPFDVGVEIYQGPQRFH